MITQLVNNPNNPKRRELNAPVLENPEAFVSFLSDVWKNYDKHKNCIQKFFAPKVKGIPIVMTSGGYDPIHPGHISCLQHVGGSPVGLPFEECFHIALVNGDWFLSNKKGKPFMDLETRARIVAAIRGVDAVVKFEIENDVTVCEALKIIQPTYFANGGDRNNIEEVPEYQVCKDNNIQMLFNIGKKKVQSSSGFLEKWK